MAYSGGGITAQWDSGKMAFIITGLTLGGGGGDGCDCPPGLTMTEVNAAITAHNASGTAHPDLRTLLNTFLDGLPTYNPATGDLTFTRHDGATLTINTIIDSLLSGWDYDFTTHEFVITKSDGTEIRIDAADLVKVYTGSIGDNIQISVAPNGTISAVLLDGTVGIEKLTAGLQALIADKLDATATAADSAMLGGHLAGLFLRRDGGDAVGLYTVRDFADTAAAITYSTANPSTIVFAAIPEEVEP
jgi:hypothetical protein